MDAALKRRAARAPPPTPIATGKGLRSAAVDDRVLTEYLENSLKVPRLSLPSNKSPTPTAVPLPSLIAGDDLAVRAVLRSAAEIGAFWIDGGDFEGRNDVRWLIEVAGRVFGIEEEREEEKVLEESIGQDGYRIFREKMEKVTSRLEFVAESITKILSEHVEIQSNCAKTNKANSVLSLRKYKNTHLLRRIDITEHHDSPALSIHISINDYKFCVRSPNSNSFILPFGSILVTLGQQFEDLCNGQLRSFSGEIFLEPSDDRLTPLSLELMYSLPGLNFSDHSLIKTVTLLDQILILLFLAFLYNILS